MSVKTKIRAPSKRVHVISKNGSWAVKKEGASRASKIHGTKENAVKDAQEKAKKGFDVIIHKKDGTIQKWSKSKA
ncbi:MAG: DUF2188 domain-containing protein [FCB group bacterium]|nr:DUF2188 domain-containing protein [FCB group bacterium]